MRLELDKDTAKTLDDIKKKEVGAGGHGHSETVRFLVRYYIDTKPVSKLIRDLDMLLTEFYEHLDTNIEEALNHTFRKALAGVFADLLAGSRDKDGEETDRRQDRASSRASRGRRQDERASPGPAPGSLDSTT